MRTRPGARGIVGLLVIANLMVGATARADGGILPPAPPQGLGEMLGSDFRYMANHLAADVQDIVTSPSHVGQLLQDKRTYWAMLAGGAAIVGSVALIDERARDAISNTNDKSAAGIQNNASMLLWGATVGLYAYGLGSGDARARQVAMTTVQSVAITGVVTGGSKLLFGRARPKQNQGARAFGVKGRSFISSATTPAFALATGFSEYWNNRWYAAVPAYGLAGAVGYARMRRDAHWFSDVMVSALVGIGSTKLLLRMHSNQDLDPNRFRIFPMVTAGGGLGVGASYAWGGPPKVVTPLAATKKTAETAALAPLPGAYGAWKSYQQGAFMKPVLDGASRWDPRYPELDFGLASN